MAAGKNSGHKPVSDPDPKSGFCKRTETYYSLRPSVTPPASGLAPSVADAIFSSLVSSRFSSGTALIDPSTDERISFAQLADYVQSLADFLSALGLRKGESVLVICPNYIYVPIVYLSVLSVGAVLTASNPASTAHDVSYQCRLSKPVLAVLHSSTVHLAPKSLPHPPIIIDSPHFIALLKPDRQKPVHNVSAEQGGRPRMVRTRSDIRPDDPATILYSSGTTGRIKGVLLTHRNYTAMLAASSGRWAEREAAGTGLLTVPMFHIYGFFFILNAVAVGETTVVLSRFSMGSMLQAVEKYRVNYIAAAPPVVVLMAKSEMAGQYDLSSLVVVGSGGAPLGKDVIDRFTARFPQVEIVTGYGLTESTGGITSLMGPEETKRHGSAGKLAANVEAKIIDPESGAALPPGKQGELWLRGEPIMKGYVNDDEATSSTLHPEGWLKTGDLCYFDEEGFLFVVDRLKELIKYKGYQVAPADLEHLLHGHPEIADVAVIPYPDEEAGQVPMAFVVRQPNSRLTEAQVMAFVAEKVAPYKRVRRVAFVSSIPKNAAGKILRKDLAKLALPTPPSRL
ncbi:4-coumarate--CoA ligase-like 9 [Nymphaea colorata]|nr:4-coumarate--CoA ligase-like 9 [Nymphaea colorata]